MTKTIEETYKKLTQREHVLHRSGMYIGSVKKQMEELWVVKDTDTGIQMEKKMVEYSPGFMKIFDEVLTNATDHSFRDDSVKCIKVCYSQETGEISVWNDGSGIPIELHKEHNMYVPELIFGHLLSGSNYTDSDNRTGAGTNGLGSKVSNIYSKQFIVETVDSKEKKKFIQIFSDNMTQKKNAKVTCNSGKSYTKITFIPDYPRFEMQGLEDDTVLLIRKRVLDCIACTNANVQVYLNGEKLKGKGLVDYTKYFFEDEKVIHESFVEKVKQKNGETTEYTWEYAIVPHTHYEQVSFVNGNATTQGGKHVDYIMYQIINKLKKMLEDKKKLKELKPNFIKDKMFLFLRATVANPTFNSQTKEQLTTPSKDFGCTVTVTDNFISKLYKSPITEEIVEFCKAKETASLGKQTDGRKVNKVYIPKLEDALNAGTSKSSDCTLILTEGLSAMTFALHGRSVVGPEKYAVYPLKGKVLNIRDATIAQLVGNEEINNIKQIIGLKQGKIYKDTSELRYGKVMILTDADCISGDTPLLLKTNRDLFEIKTVDDLTSEWYSIGEDKYCGHVDYKIWSDNEWTDIKRIIKKKTNKRMYRIVTHTGSIDVTEDHPLLTEGGIEHLTKNCKINDLLLHDFPYFTENKMDIPDNYKELSKKSLDMIASQGKIQYYQLQNKQALISALDSINNRTYHELNAGVDITEDEAYVMGFFQTDGSCDVYKWIYNHKQKDRPKAYDINRTSYSWHISNHDLEKLKKSKEILKRLYELEFKIIEDRTSENRGYDKHYKLIINGGVKTKDIIQKYRTLFYDKDKLKKIPSSILNAPRKIRQRFLEGIYDGDGDRKGFEKHGTCRIDINGKIGTQGLFFLYKSMGYEVSVNNRTDKPSVYTLIFTNGHQQSHPHKVKKIIDLGYTTDYVYDLETSNHHFQAGIGQMIVHNCDGSHIKSLLISMFHYWWPSLVKLDFIQTLKTPIVKAIKGKKVLEFFTEQDYLKWKESGINVKSFNIRYFKGLGTSKKEDAKDTFSRLDELKVDYYYKDKKCDESILLAFEKDKNIIKAPKVKDTESDDQPVFIKCTDRRKKWLSNYDKNVYVDVKENRVSYQDLINKELIHFSIYDNLRSIPSLCDGLKPSQRKILYYMLKTNRTDLIKVAQLSGYVSAETGYHHGEVSLQGAIIGMAQDFVGSNNINLLNPDGNFGTRYVLGKDAASPRYIFTKLSNITTLLFNHNDIPLYEFLDDNGTTIEPEWYLPVIPMVLVNGCEGIGTGYSTYVPSYNPKDIISNILKMIDDEDFEPLLMKPYFKGFHGEVQEVEDSKGSYVTKGKWKKLSDTQIVVTELPVGVGVTTYKEFLESLVVGNVAKKTDKAGAKATKRKFELKDVKNLTKDENDDIRFIVEFNQATDLQALITSNTLEKELKLTKSFSTNNMHLFSDKLILTKYDTCTDILCEFFDIRLEYYQKRKDYIIKKLKQELVILEARARFIKEYIEGELLINRKSKDYIIKLLTELKYPKDGEDDKFDYLLRMPIYSLTFEKIDELTKQCTSKNQQLAYYKTTSPEQLWKVDLEELLAKLK